MLWLIVNYIACLSFCIIQSGFHIRMRGNSHSSTKLLFLCCTCTCWYVFKNLYTFKLLDHQPVSVCKGQCLNLQRNARNLDWLSEPVHRTFLKGSTLLYQLVDAIAAVVRMLYFAKARWPDWRKSIRTVINLFIAVVCSTAICWNVYHFETNSSEMTISTIFKTIPVSDMRHCHGNGSILMTDLQRLSLQMAWLLLCQIWSEFLKC